MWSLAPELCHLILQSTRYIKGHVWKHVMYRVFACAIDGFYSLPSPNNLQIYFERQSYKMSPSLPEDLYRCLLIALVRGDLSWV